MSFAEKTRLRRIELASQAKGASSPLVFRVSKAGILHSINLLITGSLAGTLGTPNPMGMASIVSRVRVSINSGVELHSFTGIDYHYMIRDMMEDFKDPVPFSNGRSAVSITTFDLSMYIPIALNLRDPIGLFMLQNEQTELIISVEFESDVVVASGGAVVSATVQPVLNVFSTPDKKEDYPDFSMLHSFVSESRAITATGPAEYVLPRGNTYLGLYMGYGVAVAGADKFDSVQFRALQSDALETLKPKSLDVIFGTTHGRTRIPGTISLDWIGSSGLGSYGSARDAIPSALISDLKVVMNVTTQPDTWRIVRRQLIQLN